MAWKKILIVAPVLFSSCTWMDPTQKAKHHDKIQKVQKSVPAPMGVDPKSGSQKSIDPGHSKTLRKPPLAQAPKSPCVFSWDLSRSVIEGTGFKFTKKVGVSGRFHRWSVEPQKTKSSVKELMEGIRVIVDLMSLDSKNPLRDKNLKQTLFAPLAGLAQVQVQVQSVTDKKIQTLLTLNNKNQPVEFTYEIKGNRVLAQSSVDFMDFSMYKPLRRLKKRCHDLHKGVDGKSVTWSTFDLKVEAHVKKSCPPQ